jgi:multidrug efflux pump subunit AcrA (membrane-fusion protein)
VVPVTAVSRVGAQFFAYLAQGEGQAMKASQRPLKLGPINGDNYVVLEGLQPGDKLVISGAQNLTDGAKLAVLP